MEEQNSEDYRNPHLKSQTYQTLVRFMSLCYDNPQLLQPLPSLPHDLFSEKFVVEANEGDGGFDGRVEEKDMADNVGSVCNETETIRVDDNEIGNVQMVFDDIEDTMNIEEDMEVLKKRPMDDSKNGLKDVEMSELQQLLFDELEHAMNGEVEDVSNLNKQQIVKAADSSVDKSNTCEISKPNDHVEDTMGLTNTVESRMVCQENQKERESENFLCTGPIGLPNRVIEKGEIQERGITRVVEEGEIQERGITGQFEADGSLIDMHSKEKETEENQVSFNMIDKTKCAAETTKGNFRDTGGSTKNETVCQRKVVVYEDPILAEEGTVNKTRKRKFGNAAEEQKNCKKTKGKKMDNGGVHQGKHIVAIDGPKASNKQISDESTLQKNGSKTQGIKSKEKDESTAKMHKDGSETQGIKSKEKDDGTTKKKRGPSSKEKKKQKRRKKRAEKNRELGVKRLKLKPVVKPKPVVFCRHYLVGRCQEGEKCKFSHDTVPLTKSKPCCHFARNACMKGDDCPFDHQLSKYPCSNYASKGFCSRGENCLFSHKVPSQENIPSTSIVGTPDNKTPLLPSASNFQKQPDIGNSVQTPKSTPNSTGVISCKNSVGNVTKTATSSPAVVPKGITFLSGGKSSSHPKPGSSSMKTNEGVNQVGHNAAATVQSTDEKALSTSQVVRPKGINFLAFGKPFLGSPSIASPISPSSDQQTGMRPPSENNFSMHKPGSAYPSLYSAQVSKEISRSSVNMQSKVNEIIQKIELAKGPQIANPFSLREVRKDAPENIAQGGLLSSSLGVREKLVEGGKVPVISDGHQNLDVTPREQPGTSHGSGQLLGRWAHERLQNTSNSAQKALTSTLAFAAKFESRTSHRATDVVASGNGINKETLPSRVSHSQGW